MHVDDSMMIRTQVTRALKDKVDNSWIHAWRDDEIMLNLPLVSVVNQIDTGINAFILDLTVARHIGMPVRGIIADEVITFPRKFVQTDEVSLRIRSCKSHSQDTAGVRSSIRALGF